jgi:iron uptake system component EfeO
VNRNRCFTVLTTALALALAVPHPAWADGAAGELIAVTVTASACEPDELKAPPGRTTFSIHNAASEAIEWEILDGVMVVDERENIPPGATKTLTVRLAAGEYQITCGLLSNPKGKLFVPAQTGLPAMITQTDLIGPLAEYRVYTSNEIDGLLDATQRLADALTAGNIALARALYSTAHTHYARIAPIALYFPDLDGIAEADSADPAAKGFRLLEAELSARERSDLAPLANKLVQDVLAMQSRFENLPVTPGPTFSGATQTFCGAIAIEAEHPSLESDDLLDLQAYVEGVQKIVELFQPLIQKTNVRLSVALMDDFSTLASTLRKYGSAENPLERSVRMRSDDHILLQSLVRKISDELSLIPSALGIG